MRISLVLCVLLASLSPLRAQQKMSPLEREIIPRENSVWDLSERHEWGLWAKLLADDVLAVYSSGYASKTDVLKTLQSDRATDYHHFIDQLRVIPIGPSAGLIVYRVVQDWHDRGKRFDRNYYVSSLWEKQQGRWINRFWQETDTTLPDDQLSAAGLAKEKEFQEAQKRNDWAACAALLSDDLVAIDEDGIRNKEQFLAEVKDAEIRFSDYRMEDVRTIPDGDGAIVAYRQTLVGTQRGKPFTWQIYTHSHWQRRGDKWLLTMFQDTMAKER